MSISEPFIRRPIATSLLMLGVLVFGIGAYNLLAGGGGAQCRFSDDHRDRTVSGRQSQHDGVGGRDATRTAIHLDPVAERDDVVERRRRHFDHAAIRPEPQYRCRGGGRAAGDQCGQRPVAQGHADPTDLPQGEPGELCRPDLRCPFRRPAALQGRRLRHQRHRRPPVDRARGRAGLCLRLDALCRPRPDQSGVPRRQGAGAGGRPQRARRGTCQPAEGRNRGRTDQSIALDTNDQLFNAAQYGNIIIAYKNGAPVRIKDVGDVINSVQNDRLLSWFGDQRAEGIAIQKEPGANTIAVVDRIKALMPKLEQSLPPAVHVDLMSDRSQTTRASIRDVQLTMMLTIGLVIVVIFLFLRTMWATVIPSLAVPLSLLATFAVMYVAGYSLDNISLMALDDLGRLHRRRCDRHDREHRALYRAGHAAVRCRAERRRADRLYDYFDHLFADRGIHAVVLHGRHHRPAVPRVCRHRSRSRCRVGDRYR